jgi:predicted DCC family thiol-disulfide oxidoreductase YuxK
VIVVRGVQVLAARGVEATAALGDDVTAARRVEATLVEPVRGGAAGDIDDGFPAYPLTLYFDDSCPLCRAEMAAITRFDHDARIRLVDCSCPSFDDSDCRAAGIATGELMRRLHARDAEGRWRVGVPAVAAAYTAVGLAGIGGFFASPGLQGPLARLYGWLADHRQGLSRIGLTGLFGRYVEWLGRRSLQRASACHAGACEFPHH